MNSPNNYLTRVLNADDQFTIASEEELIQAFRPRDQKKLILPNDFEFPMEIPAYLTWQESSGVYTYLIYKRPNWELPRGVAFKRTATTGEATGGLCNWCHSYGGTGEISMLSVTMSSTISLSYYLCSDLSCLQKIHNTSGLAGKDPQRYIQELNYRMEKLFENISSYKPE